jgi:hypothetical protein
MIRYGENRGKKRSAICGPLALAIPDMERTEEKKKKRYL